MSTDDSSAADRGSGFSAGLGAGAEARSLAVYLARELFALGERTGGYPVSRIQFKLGSYGNERDGGGLAEEPLARFLAEALRARSSA